MGGNALKDFTWRMTKDEYEELKKKVVTILNSFDLSLKIGIPPSYSSKETFGDLDVVVGYRYPHEAKMIIEFIRELVHPKAEFHNKMFYSFEFNEKQVDLIFVPEAHFEMTLDYYSYNDLFNLAGRLARRIGLKLGNKGLSIVVRNGNYQLGEVILTNDLFEIFQILDL